MGDGISVIAVPADQFERWRPRLQRYFDSFADRSGGSLRPDTLPGHVRDRDMQCWAVVGGGGDTIACALTNIMDDETKTCVITHCAGHDYEQWSGELLATIYAWSRTLGSTKLEAVTRPGWERALRRYGMRKTHVILELGPHGQSEAKQHNQG